MTGIRSLPLWLFLMCSSVWLWAQPGEEIDWIYEIDLLGKELAEKHPDLFFKVDSATFYSAFDQIAQSSTDLSLFEISIRLQQVLAKMGDAHTLINYHFNIDPEFILPIECEWFQEGIYILKAPIEYNQILGHRLLAINGHPVEKISDSLSTLLTLDNFAVVKNQVPKMIKWTQLLAYFEFTNNREAELLVLDGEGNEIQASISLPQPDGEIVAVKPDSIPFGYRDRKAYFRDHYFPADDLYYIQYNRCWSREMEEEFGTGASALFMPSFKEFEKEVFQVIRKNPIDKLVFDLRFNSGGNSEQGTGFIKKLCKSLKKGGGKIYVVVGPKTFSSAIINVMDFVNNAEVIMVGEETGGKPNHFGEIKRFVLPESRLVVNHSTKYFKLVEGDPPSIRPQVATPLSFDTYMRGIDSALEAIKSSGRQK